MKFKTELNKYKYTNNYELKLYIPQTKGELTDFFSQHFYKKLNGKKYFSREYNNKNRGYDVLVIENLTKLQAEKMQKYAIGLLAPYFGIKK